MTIVCMQCTSHSWASLDIYVIQQLHDCADLGPWTAVLRDDDLTPRGHILWSQ